jgi:hypothetical protein
VRPPDATYPTIANEGRGFGRIRDMFLQAEPQASHY